MLDLFILIIICWSLYSGWRAGLVREITSTVGFLVGLLIAATCYSAFGRYLAVNGSHTNMITSIIAFFLLWIIVPIVLGFVANMLTCTLKGLRLGWANSVLGAGIALIKYGILLSCLLSVMSGLGILDTERTQNSRFYAPLKGACALLIDQVLPETHPSTTTPDSLSPSSSLKNDTVWVPVQKKKQ